MKNFLRKNLFPVSVAGIIMSLVVMAFVSSSSGGKIASAQQGGSNYIQKMNISKGVSVASSSTQLLPASSGRVYAVFVNDSSNPVYLSLDGNAAVMNSGIRLNASGGSYEINMLNQDVGIVNAIASGTSVVTVTASQ